uniref:Putative tail tubular protein n=1 Tax=viral metagenome TaxID=1070528 RepID=A0A6M3IRG6_9ZZZZ
MKVDVIKNSFVGGEFGPSLFGRTDITQYQYACETVENFLVRPYGSLISTPGTKYVAEVKSSGTNTRLIKFIFARNDSYVIEMGDSYFRFFTDGGAVTTGGGGVLEVAHSYSSTQIWDVQYAQINDVIYLSHADHRTKKLTRVSSSSWTFTDFDFLGGPFLDDNTTAITITPSATDGTVTLTLSATNSTTYFRTGSTTHIGSYWRVGASRTSTTTGLTIQPYVKITAFTSSTIAVGTVMEQLASSSATDDWAEGAWSSVRGYPARITFHEKRLFFARTATEPQKVWGSKSYIYDDFAVGAEDDDGLNLALASNESNELQWLLSGKVLIAGSYGGEFVISATNEGPLTPTTTIVNRTSSWGSEAIVPKKIGNYLYFVQRFGKKIRELFYQWENDAYKSVDKTILSPQILGDGVKDLAYQSNPDTVLWCVRTDGTIATLTREVDQEVMGWARQTTEDGDGYYEAVATIPNRTEAYDEVWVIVRRTINGTTKRYVELFNDITVPDRQELCGYLHSALTYNAFDAYTTTTISLSATMGSLAGGTYGTVLITASTPVFTVATDAGDRIRTIDSDGVVLGEAKIISVASTTVTHCYVTNTFSTTAYAASSWGQSVSQISGLDHLEAKTLKVLADGGMDSPDPVVTGGVITLNYNYFIVTAGLPYTQKIKTLPIEAGSPRGTAQSKRQRISEVGFKVNRSYKGFKVGGETDYLELVQWRDPTTEMGTPELLYTGVMSNISFRDDYKYGPVVLLHNEDPLPIELLNIIFYLDTYDK